MDRARLAPDHRRLARPWLPLRDLIAMAGLHAGHAERAGPPPPRRSWSRQRYRARLPPPAASIESAVTTAPVVPPSALFSAPVADTAPPPAAPPEAIVAAVATPPVETLKPVASRVQKPVAKPAARPIAVPPPAHRGRLDPAARTLEPGRGGKTVLRIEGDSMLLELGPDADPDALSRQDQSRAGTTGDARRNPAASAWPARSRR